VTPGRLLTRKPYSPSHAAATEATVTVTVLVRFPHGAWSRARPLTVTGGPWQRLAGPRSLARRTAWHPARALAR
jgi:hypothetical protein